MIINLTSIKSKKIRFEHEDVDENWTAAEFRSVANDMPELADRFVASIHPCPVSISDWW